VVEPRQREQTVLPVKLVAMVAQGCRPPSQELQLCTGLVEVASAPMVEVSQERTPALAIRQQLEVMESQIPVAVVVAPHSPTGQGTAVVAS